jgi:hypothetical protein
MADFSTKYGTVTGVTVTLANKANGVKQQSTEIDNTTTKAVDYLVYCKVLGTGTTTGPINVYVGGQLGDDLRPAGLGASDAVFSGKLEELAFLDSIPMNDTTSVVVVLRAGVASCFGGVCPAKFCLVFENASGTTTNATGGNFDINVIPIHYSAV